MKPATYRKFTRHLSHRPVFGKYARVWLLLLVATVFEIPSALADPIRVSRCSVFSRDSEQYRDCLVAVLADHSVHEMDTVLGRTADGNHTCQVNLNRRDMAFELGERRRDDERRAAYQREDQRRREQGRTPCQILEDGLSQERVACRMSSSEGCQAVEVRLPPNCGAMVPCTSVTEEKPNYRAYFNRWQARFPRVQCPDIELD